MTFKFKDGTIFEATLPDMIIDGIIMGDTIVRFSKGFIIK